MLFVIKERNGIVLFSVLPNYRCEFIFYMKQALRAVPYMAISSESLLSAVMDMEGTQKCPWHRCFI